MTAALHYVGNSQFERSDGDSRIRNHGDYELVLAPVSSLLGLPVSAIRDAMSDAREAGDIVALAWWLTHESEPHTLYSPSIIETFRIELTDDGDVAVIVNLDDYVEPGDVREAELERAFRPFIARTGSSYAFHDTDPYTGSANSVLQIAVPPTIDGDELLKIAHEAVGLVAATRGGSLSLASTADLVRSGLLRPLQGQPERLWLDGKSSPYRLSTVKEKLEFAKDVASFANAEGGLIVVGVEGNKSLTGDVLGEVVPFPLELMNPEQCRSILADRVFPAVDDLDVGLVELEAGRGIGFIYVPPQAGHRKPFLVRGADVDGHLMTTAIALPTRQGEDTRWAEIAEIHALLQAGRLATALIDQHGIHGQAVADNPKRA